jgi:hypothetical protein
MKEEGPMTEDWDVPTALRAISDPVERARAAQKVTKQKEQIVQVRDDAVNELMRQHGWKPKDVVALLNVSRGLVSQIAKKGPGPERAFLGSGQLTVALGGKSEAKQDRPGPVVAQEDLYAYEHLRKLAEHMGLKAEYEVIPPPGNVRLNRDDLIVVCGPRLSPLIGQILESDPHLRFTHDEHGWYLADQTTGKVYRSPMDRDEPGDVAYFARLPRPDARGTFLYVAGIHAMGSSGVVHWLSSELASIYSELRLRRFSTLISCQFDPATREITSSERVTPLYRAEGA